MRQLHNPKLIKEAISVLSLDKVFSKDYSDAFLLLEYDKDEFLIREGYVQQYLFFIVSGDVRCFSDHQSGKSQFICYLRPSESSGVIGSFWGKPAVTNNQAVNRCRVLALPLSQYRAELMDDNKFLRYLVSELGKLVNQNNRYQQITQLTSVESKIASLILHGAKDGVCRLNISSAAEIACTTYRHVLRILQKMVADGVLQKNGKDYYLKDEAYLTLLAEDSYDVIVSEHYSLP